MRWLCLPCRSEYDERPPTCGTCLSSHALVPLPARHGGRDVVVAPRLRVGVVRAAELRPTEAPAPYAEPWSSWQLGEPHAVLLVGPPGGGKSTLATLMAVSAARRVGVLYVAVEQGHSATVQARLERAGLDDLTAQRLRVSDARTHAEVEEDLGAVADARLVVVDSATELRASAEWLATTLAGRSWIGIAHANTRGTARGGGELEHAVDVVIDVEDGAAQPRKNRWGAMQALRIWPEETTS